LITAGKGKAVVKTVADGNLALGMKGKMVSITDENGGVAYVTIKDVNQKQWCDTCN